MFANFFLERLGRESLIAPDDTWALLALLMVSVALAGAEIPVGVQDLGRYHCTADRAGGVQPEHNPHQLPAV